MVDQSGIVFRKGFKMHVRGIDELCEVVSIHDDKSIDVKVGNGDEVINVPFENYMTAMAAMSYIDEIIGADNKSVNIGDKVRIRTDTYGEEEAEKIEESQDASLYRANDGAYFLYKKKINK